MLKANWFDFSPSLIFLYVKIDFLQKFNQTTIDGCSNPRCSDFQEEYKEQLFINITVEDFIFKGYRSGTLLWIIDHAWTLFEKYMPTQITKENGFAVFNQKNDTADNE